MTLPLIDLLARHFDPLAFDETRDFDRAWVGRQQAKAREKAQAVLRDMRMQGYTVLERGGGPVRLDR